MSVARSVPISLSVGRFAAALRDACMRVGFFYIENYGIPNGLVGEAFERGKKLFALPFGEKMDIYVDNTTHFSGYMPLHGSGKPDAEGKGSEQLSYS